VAVAVGVGVGGRLMMTVPSLELPRTELPAWTTSVVRGKVRLKVTAVPPGGVAALALKRIVAKVNVPVAVEPSSPAE
jgi:hypothetical protein